MTEENIRIVRLLIEDDHRPIVSEIPSGVDISYDNTQTIITDDFG